MILICKLKINYNKKGIECFDFYIFAVILKYNFNLCFIRYVKN